MRTMLPVLVVAAVVAVTIDFGGQRVAELTAAPIVPQAPGTDCFGDALPPGAAARLGTISFRHGRIASCESLNFTPDGTSLVSTGGGWVRRWDIATGREIVAVGDGWRSSRTGLGTDLASADGKIARLCLGLQLPNGGSNWQCSEYDLESGKERRNYRLGFPAGTNDAHSLPRYLSPDGKTYAGISSQGGLTLWNAVDGTVTHHLKPQDGAYSAVAFVPDGKSVIVGNGTHNIRVFDLTSGEQLRSFGIPDGNVVVKMAISADSKWLVTAGGAQRGGDTSFIYPHDQFLRLWNFSEGTLVRKLDLPENPRTQSLLFTADSRLLIAGFHSGARGVVRSWDVKSGEAKRAWTDEPSIGWATAISRDGKTLATMGKDGVIRFFDVQTGKEKSSANASPCALDAVCFRPDGKSVVTVGRDMIVRAWELGQGRLVDTATAPLEGFQPRFGANGRLVLTTVTKGEPTPKTKIYDSLSRTVLRDQAGGGVVISSDGKLALRGPDRCIHVLELATGKTIRTVTPPDPEKPPRGFPSIPRGFTADGQSLIVQSETVAVWDLKTGKQKSSWSILDQNVLETPPGQGMRGFERLSTAAVSPDGKLIAFALLKDAREQNGPSNWFARIMLFETTTGKLQFQTDLGRDEFSQLAFSPNGKVLAAGGLWTANLWYTDTGKSVGVYEGHRGRITSLAFSPDGRQLASASEDSTVLIWNVAK